MVIFIALVMAVNQGNINEAMVEYRKIQREVHPLDDFSKIDDKVSRFNALLESGPLKNNNEHFMVFYLRKLKRDLEIIKKMSISEKAEFSLIYQDFFSYLLVYFKDDPFEKGFTNILKIEKALIRSFGNFSFMHIFSENLKLTVILEFNKKYDFKKLIMERYNYFQNSDWKNNPELSFFLVMLCANCERTEEYEEMIVYGNELSNTVSNNFPKDDIKRLDHQGYLLLAYTKTKKFEKAYEIFKEIDKEKFLSIKRESSKVFFRIHSSSFEFFTNLGMKKEAMQSQQLKLEAMAFFIKDDDPSIVSEAKILRDLYNDAKETEKAKKTESRFKLSPMSK